MCKIAKWGLIYAVILNVAFPCKLSCQNINNIGYSYSDTTIVSDSLGKCIHIKSISKTSDIDYQINFQNKLLINKYNKHTRLIYTSKYDSFNIPTAPLSHLYILREKGVIVGLSSYENSPYNILIYSFSGKLLNKRCLQPLALKLSKNDLKCLIQIHPRFKKFLVDEKPFVLKTNDSFYVEVNNQIINYLILRKKYDKKDIYHKSLIPCHYFSERFGTSSNQANYKEIDNKLFYQFRSHTKFFNLQNPLVDLIIDENIPYLLILRDYKNSIVNVPLVSNCDMISELGMK